jgi:rhodanese-related sulfurtransferase
MNTDAASMNVAELAAWREAGTPHYLLDVREPHELAIGAIENAHHIPMGEIPARIGEIPSGEPVVVMCHHGSRSLQVVNFLRRSGRSKVLNLEGGIDAWSSQIDGAVARY